MNDEDPIDKYLRDEAERLFKKSESASFNQAKEALLSENRKAEFEIMAKMSRMIYDAYRREGFNDEQAFIFTEIITQRTLYPVTATL